MYYLMGTTKNQVRTSKSGNLQQLRKYGENLAYYAIYKEYTSKGRFHNATDQSYLVEHKNDPFWLNNGVASK